MSYIIASLEYFLNSNKKMMALLYQVSMCDRCKVPLEGLKNLGEEKEIEGFFEGKVWLLKLPKSGVGHLPPQPTVPPALLVKFRNSALQGVFATCSPHG